MTEINASSRCAIIGLDSRLKSNQSEILLKIYKLFPVVTNTAFELIHINLSPKSPTVPELNLPEFTYVDFFLIICLAELYAEEFELTTTEIEGRSIPQVRKKTSADKKLLHALEIGVNQNIVTLLMYLDQLLDKGLE